MLGVLHDTVKILVNGYLYLMEVFKDVWEFKKSFRFYVDRIAGGNLHYCVTDGHIDAGSEQGP